MSIRTLVKLWAGNWDWEVLTVDEARNLAYREELGLDDVEITILGIVLVAWTLVVIAVSQILTLMQQTDPENWHQVLITVLLAAPEHSFAKGFPTGILFISLSSVLISCAVHRLLDKHLIQPIIDRYMERQSEREDYLRCEAEMIEHYVLESQIPWYDKAVREPRS